MTNRIDRHGIVSGKPYHDGIICEVHADLSMFSLQIKKLDTVTTFSVEKVHTYGMSPLRHGAIVSYIFVYNKEMWRTINCEPGGAWDVLYGGEMPKEDLEKNAELLMRNSPDGTLLANISCSYGGSISILGSEWNLV